MAVYQVFEILVYALLTYSNRIELLKRELVNYTSYL